MTLRGGLFSDLSNAPRIPRDPDSYRLARVHRFGGAVGAGIDLSGFVFNLGFSARFGIGHGVGIVGMLNDSPDYARRRARQETYLVTISGAMSIVKAVRKAISSDVPD